MNADADSTPDRIGSFSQEKKELLRLLKEESNKQRNKISARLGRNPDDLWPTSFAQQRLWFIDHLSEGSARYPVSITLRLEGALNTAALQCALDGIMERHEVLRTSFVNRDGLPVQHIAAERRFPLRMIKMEYHEGEDELAPVQAHQLEELYETFDLAAGLTIRGRLLELSKTIHVLIITMHHIVCDGWSKSVLIKELAQLYRKHLSGREPRLQPLPLQYADYAEWEQRRWAESASQENPHLAHWLARLDGAAPQLYLPTDRPRPLVRTYRGENVRLRLEEDLTDTLKGFARSRQLTLFMLLYAAWAALLSRISGQSDILIGTPVANRHHPEIEGLIGPFVNTLVLRADVQPGQSVDELLKQVRQRTLEDFNHQETPFEKIVEALKPNRASNINPLFQVILVLHNEPPISEAWPHLSVTREDEVDEPAILDLWISLEERGHQITGSVNYAAEMFDRSTIERWVSCFPVLLRAMIDCPSLRVQALPMLPADERARLIELPRESAPRYSEERPLHILFEERVRVNPTNTALIFEGQSLTYSELNFKANQLARHLRAQGVGPEKMVAILVERSLEMVISILAVLKAGGAYVPLDPLYPTERLAYVLKDAAPCVVLTQGRFRDTVPVSSAKLIAVDDDQNGIWCRPRHNLASSDVEVAATNLAYVIYTSGSTGNPKGVMVEHRNVTRLFAATEDWFNFDDRDVWTLFHSFAFDFSVWELWGALLYGGSVVVVPRATVRSPRDFYHLICKQKVTVLNQTPSAFSQLIEAQEGVDYKHYLREVIFGGEALELRTLKRWVERNGLERPRLVNMYGITETTVHVTYHPLSDHDFLSQHRSPIGVGIPDLRLYVVDPYLQPVPVGVAGEVFVGGAGVARGYLNRPMLTAERFLAAPFNDRHACRLYRSGDLVRRRSDDSFDYFGRSDKQVKIRGYRIELGEIEAQLSHHDGIGDVVVVAREDDSGERRLVAYVTSTDGKHTDAGELRDYLKERLPEYMIPSAFMVLDQMPLTENGKLDARSLPAPSSEAYETSQYDPPVGVLEELVADIWKEILNLERVSRSANFFEIGGHSLIATKLTANIATRCNIFLGAAALFRYPTIQQLAQTIAQLQREGTASEKVEKIEIDEGMI